MAVDFYVDCMLMGLLSSFCAFIAILVGGFIMAGTGTLERGFLV